MGNRQSCNGEKNEYLQKLAYLLLISSKFTFFSLLKISFTPRQESFSIAKI